MTNKYARLLPGTFELVSLIFLTVLVVILGNSRQLLDYYGLSTTNTVLRQSAGDAITRGLSRLDSFSLTSTVVTFLIWAAVGLLCFSIAQAIARGYHEFQREEELSSNRYVHPSTFTRRDFWRHVAGNFGLLVVGLLLLAIVLYLFFGYIMPIGLTYAQLFLQGVSIIHAGYFLLGLAVIYVGLVAIDLSFRFLTQRHRLIS